MTINGSLKVVITMLQVFFFPKLISFSLFDIVIIINMARPAETEHESLSIFS